MPAHSKRTPEMVEAILEGMSKGQTLTSLCAQWDLHPTTWNDWCAADEVLGIAHGRARDAGYDAIASALRETARGTGESTQDVQRDKLIIETDLKLLAKWDPRRYGDKQIHSGDPDNPIATTVDVSGLSVGALRELAKLRLPE